MQKNRTGKGTFGRRLTKVWILGVALPLLAVELLFLVQFYRINYNKVDEGIREQLERTARDMTEMMDSMKTVSWLLEGDGTVGKNLYQYLGEEDTLEKADLLIYLREQIANYEVTNPAVGNLTYLYVPDGQKMPVKINQTSLASGALPAADTFLCQWENLRFFGPHPSESSAANYTCLSLLRRYRTLEGYGDIYIYVESGFRYLEKLEPHEVEAMGGVFWIESSDGSVRYTSDESVVAYGPAAPEDGDDVWAQGRRFKSYERAMRGDWKLHFWIPASQYYGLVYQMALNLGVVTLLLLSVCILVSVLEWHSIYREFARFDARLRAIAEDSDVGGEVERMNIREFDEHFELFDKMKKNILRLMDRAREDEKHRRELEARVVLGKINPHFLYNTLDTLKWYAAGNSDREMVRFITALNRLLLYNMSRDEKTTLEKELEAIQAYISLQKLKYDLNFTLNTGKHSEILQTVMPRFILQPIVENAIRHSGCDRGEIGIDVDLLASGKISVLVKNDGSPIDPERIRQVLGQKQDISSNGIGLQYVARMLESFYGEDFVLRAERTEDGFNVVEIRIPFAAEEIL